MLEINFVRNHREKVLTGLKKRGFQDEDLAMIDQLIALDDQRKQAQTSLDEKLAERNRLSKEIGDMFKAG